MSPTEGKRRRRWCQEDLNALKIKKGRVVDTHPKLLVLHLASEATMSAKNSSVLNHNGATTRYFLRCATAECFSLQLNYTGVGKIQEG
jgi:hypothetical protein